MRPKLTLSCSTEGKEGRKEGRKDGRKEARKEGRKEGTAVQRPSMSGHEPIGRQECKPLHHDFLQSTARSVLIRQLLQGDNFTILGLPWKAQCFSAGSAIPSF
jgi:hypothetical protein